MPNRNGWGPVGRGAMTGQGRGSCGGGDAQTDGPPRGFGWGRGRGGGGRGWRHRGASPSAAETSRRRPRIALAGLVPQSVESENRYRAALKREAQSLEQRLDELKSRLQELLELDRPVPGRAGEEQN